MNGAMGPVTVAEEHTILLIQQNLIFHKIQHFRRFLDVSSSESDYPRLISDYFRAKGHRFLAGGDHLWLKGSND